MSNLKGRVAVLFGAGSGIGAAVSRRFVVEGAAVVAAGLATDSEELKLSQHGIELTGCDVTDDTQVHAVVKAVLSIHGKIDILVNSAGIIEYDRAATIDDGKWARVHDINLQGTMRTMRAVLPHMLTRRSGAIVNIASVAAFNAGADSASYAASKAGVVALSRSAAQSYGPEGIRVNALCPGWVDTPMARKEMHDLARELGISYEQAYQRTVMRVSLGRMAQPDEIASVCLFLASDESAFVTGAALVADGGARIVAAARA